MSNEALKFSDTLMVLGYDSSGKKLRGRPRGRKNTPTPFTHDPIFSKVGISVENNKALADLFMNKMILKIIISGYNVRLVLKDSTIISLR